MPRLAAAGAKSLVSRLFGRVHREGSVARGPSAAVCRLSRGGRRQAVDAAIRHQTWLAAVACACHVACWRRDAGKRQRQNAEASAAPGASRLKPPLGGRILLGFEREEGDDRRSPCLGGVRVFDHLMGDAAACGNGATSSALRMPRLAAAGAKSLVSRLFGRAHRKGSVACGPSAADCMLSRGLSRQAVDAAIRHQTWLAAVACACHVACWRRDAGKRQRQNAKASAAPGASRLKPSLGQLAAIESD